MQIQRRAKISNYTIIVLNYCTRFNAENPKKRYQNNENKFANSLKSLVKKNKKKQGIWLEGVLYDIDLH